MKKIKLTILIPVINSLFILAVSFWIGEFEWAFFIFLILVGCSMVWWQKENATYKFLNKLVVGSLIFGSLSMIFIFLRMYILSNLFYDSPIPFSELWDRDRLIIAVIYMFISFLGGLLGIVLKGAYFIYKEKAKWAIIIVGPSMVALASLAVFKVKLGGTIMSGYYGFPYPYLIYQARDIVDGFTIDKWIFSPGGFLHHIIFNYLFYLSIFLFVYYISILINKKFNKKFNIVLILFALLVFLIITIISFLPIKRSYINYQITNAGYCEESSDCVIVANKCPFSCAIVVNKDEANRVNELINSFPSTCEFKCLGREKAVCLQNKCWVSIDNTSNETYWKMLKQAISNCEVNSIIQTHNLEVTAVLKNGKIIKALESEIDDVFDVVMENSDKCGEVIMSTE